MLGLFPPISPFSILLYSLSDKKLPIRSRRKDTADTDLLENWLLAWFPTFFLVTFKPTRNHKTYCSTRLFVGGQNSTLDDYQDSNNRSAQAVSIVPVATEVMKIPSCWVQRGQRFGFHCSPTLTNSHLKTIQLWLETSLSTNTNRQNHCLEGWFKATYKARISHTIPQEHCNFS